MPDIYGTCYNGLNARPSYEEQINFVDYPVDYPDRSATWTRDSPLLTQLDGIGMMEMEEQQGRENIAINYEDIIRQIAASAGQSAQMLRAMNRGQYVPSTEAKISTT